jgi:hypothetical protein
MRGLNKKGQESIGMSFGFIFSIFLIVVFIIVAFYAIKYFLDIGEASKVGIFYRDFQDAVDEVLRTDSGNDVFKTDLPGKIKKVCFANLSATITSPSDYELIKDYEYYDANIFLIPPQDAGGMPWKLINHLNITKTTQGQNPYCISVSREIKIKKDFYDKSVRVE